MAARPAAKFGHKMAHYEEDDDESSSSSSEEQEMDRGTMAKAVAAPAAVAAAAMPLGKLVSSMADAMVALKDMHSMYGSLIVSDHQAQSNPAQTAAALVKTQAVEAKRPAEYAKRLQAYLEVKPIEVSRLVDAQTGRPQLKVPLYMSDFKSVDAALIADLRSGATKGFVVRAAFEGAFTRTFDFEVKLDGLVSEETERNHLASEMQLTDAVRGTQHAVSKMLLHGKRVDAQTGAPNYDDPDLYTWTAFDQGNTSGRFSCVFCDLSSDKDIKPLIETHGSLYMAAQPSYFKLNDGTGHYIFHTDSPYAIAYEKLQSEYHDPTTGKTPPGSKGVGMLRAEVPELAELAINKADKGLARYLLPLRLETSRGASAKEKPFATLVFSSPSEKARHFRANPSDVIGLKGKFYVDVVPCKAPAAAAAPKA